VTTGKVHDAKVMANLVREDGTAVYGDKGYASDAKNRAAQAAGVLWRVKDKAKPGRDLTKRVFPFSSVTRSSSLPSCFGTRPSLRGACDGRRLGREAEIRQRTIEKGLASVLTGETPLGMNVVSFPVSEEAMGKQHAILGMVGLGGRLMVQSREDRPRAQAPFLDAAE
jgi:hypothetical protein